ncbi:hypothetical protein [Sulfurovum sp.]|uniref:hypothetical protein n=1 Tax=Sulfurovum sp. TaxID=1969726 RepID=UPI0035640990
MSNISIANRLLEVCRKYEQNDLSLQEFQSDICAHGSALEGLGKEWDEMLNGLDSECELILYMEDSSDHHLLGLKVSEKLRHYLEQRLDSL